MAPRFAPPVPAAYNDASVARLHKLCLAHDLEPTGSRQALLLKLAWAQLPAGDVLDHARRTRAAVEQQMQGRRVSSADPGDLVAAMAQLGLDEHASPKAPKTPQDEGMGSDENKPPSGPSQAPKSPKTPKQAVPSWLRPETPKARVLKACVSDAMADVQAQARALVAEAPAEAAEEEAGVPSRVLRRKDTNAEPGKRKAKGVTTVPELRADCAKLGLLSSGTRPVLVSRLAWAALSQLELQIIARSHSGLLDLSAERSAVIETCVQAQRAGKLSPPTQFGENSCPALAETNAAARGALSRATDLHDQRRLYFVARAPTDRSSCQVCHKGICDKEWRVGSQVCGGFTKWYHGACFGSSYGRQGAQYDREQQIVDLLRELLTSEGRWSVFESQLPALPSKASRNFVKALTKGKGSSRAPRRQAVKTLWDDE